MLFLLPGLCPCCALPLGCCSSILHLPDASPYPSQLLHCEAFPETPLPTPQQYCPPGWELPQQQRDTASGTTLCSNWQDSDVQLASGYLPVGLTQTPQMSQNRTSESPISPPKTPALPTSLLFSVNGATSHPDIQDNT